MHKIGLIGTGFIGSGLGCFLEQHPKYTISGILTRTDISKRNDFPLTCLLTNSLDDLIQNSDLIVECSGDAVYATDTIDQILKASLPVVTLNAEFHITTGSYFVDKGLVTEAEGDQPGVLAILHEEALDMGFKPLVYANIKGFLNHTPTIEDMYYWKKRSHISLDMVTASTDGTKVQMEQAFIANGLNAGIVQDGLLGLSNDDMKLGGIVLADYAKELGYPICDYLLSSKLPAGVFIMAEHNKNQRNALRYFKMGDGPYYLLTRTFHLCHLEVVKTIKRVLDGGGVLLDNSRNPRISVATIAKRDLHPGETIKRGNGSFDVRGIAINIKDDPGHIPIGLFANAKIRRHIRTGQRISFDDVDIPNTFALKVWKSIIQRIL